MILTRGKPAGIDRHRQGIRCAPHCPSDWKSQPCHPPSSRNLRRTPASVNWTPASSKTRSSAEMVQAGLATATRAPSSGD